MLLARSTSSKERKLPLTDKETGYNGTIEKLEGDPTTLERLRELGFLRGQTIELVARSPFSGPIIVRVNEVTVALRQNEACCVFVKS